MKIKAVFTSPEAKLAFAKRFKLTVDESEHENNLDVPLEFLQFAKKDPNCLDYNHVSLETHQYIVKGNPDSFVPYCVSLEKDLGNGFYLVNANDGTVLGDYVDSIEVADISAKIMTVSDVTSVSGETTTLDPASSEGQWARLRIASRYRPFLETYSLHDLNFLSKPEVYLMDSGINWSHTELDYPELETEDFYKVPAFTTMFEDDVGHGTLMATAIAGKNVGIATNLKLINVKLGNAERFANMLEIGEAFDAIIARASADLTKTRIVNISWGVPRSAWLDSKIQGLVDLGITVVCAAGNSGTSVEDLSPAGMNDVLTVASSDMYDIPSGFNNISPTDTGLTTGYGLSLDLFAPGEQVMLGSKEGDYIITSGTSISSAFCSGVAAGISALYADFVPYSFLKQTILDTGTKFALLFEDETFTDKQNNILHLCTADPFITYKEDNSYYYMGCDAQTIVPTKLDAIIDASPLILLAPNEEVVYEIKFSNPELNVYAPYVSINSAYEVIITTPILVDLPESTKLQMVDFVVEARNSLMSITSVNTFFFHSNPLYSTTVDEDTTEALLLINIISPYLATFKQ